MTPHREIIKNS